MARLGLWLICLTNQRAFLECLDDRAWRFETPANAQIHYDSTGHEILNDFEGTRLDYFVAGYGTGGTFAGVGKLLRVREPNARSLSLRGDFATKQISGAGMRCGVFKFKCFSNGQSSGSFRSQTTFSGPEMLR